LDCLSDLVVSSNDSILLVTGSIPVNEMPIRSSAESELSVYKASNQNAKTGKMTDNRPLIRLRKKMWWISIRKW